MTMPAGTLQLHFAGQTVEQWPVEEAECAAAYERLRLAADESSGGSFQPGRGASGHTQRPCASDPLGRTEKRPIKADKGRNAAPQG